MSINGMMKTYEVIENKHETDSWAADTYIEHKVGTVEVAINYANASNIANDMRYAEVTHTGLTRCKTLKKDQVLVLGNERYVIYLPPNNIPRMSQLFLKAVVSDGQ